MGHCPCFLGTGWEREGQERRRWEEVMSRRTEVVPSPGGVWEPLQVTGKQPSPVMVKVGRKAFLDSQHSQMKSFT